MNNNTDKAVRAKKYNRIKVIFSFVELGLMLSFILFLIFSGLSIAIRDFSVSLHPNLYVQFLIFVLSVGLMELALFLPFTFYVEYILEHKYDLSNQTIGRWIWVSFKSLLVSAVLLLPLVLMLYYFLRNLGDFWWLAVGTILFLFTVVLSNIAPLVIFPLFYKFKPIEDGELKNSLTEMSENDGLTISGVFSFDMSRNTKKANAAFTGLGKTKRILLGDNLLENFEIDEIKSVFAHELGHYTFSHVWKLIVISGISTYVSLFIAGALYKFTLPKLGYAGVDDIAALPLLLLFLMLYGLITMPLSNGISRKYEREADRYALKMMNGKKYFISSMNKLKEMNLADWDPNPFVEFFLYSHPSIKKRIKMADKLYSE